MVSIFEKFRSKRNINFEKKIINKDFSFLIEIDNEQIVTLCDKYSSKELIEELFKMDVDKAEKFVKYVVEAYPNRSYVNNFMNQLLMFNTEKTINEIRNKKKNDNYLYEIIDLDDYEVNSNILINNCDMNFFNDVNSSNVLYKTFLYTLSYVKKDYKEAFKEKFRLMEAANMSESQISLLLECIKNISFDELLRDYLLDKRILSKYCKGEEDFVIKLLKADNYDLEDEIKLLEKLNSDSKTIEEEIVKIYKRNVNVKELSIFQVLLVEMYARKKLSSNGVEKATINLLSKFEDKGRCVYKQSTNTFVLDVNKNYPNVNTMFELIRIIEHEVAHVIQENNRINMNIMCDEDVDLYSKDHFIAYISCPYPISEYYYEDNYSWYSDEFGAEVTAYFETVKLLTDENICYQKEKDNSEKIKDLNSLREMKRYLHKFEHINDMFEDKLNDFIEEKKGEINEVEAIMKKETPILLLEYDIYKKSIPRRRTLNELVNVMENSDDKKIKNACMVLLVNRFNEFKEKKEDVNDNIEELKKMVENDEISLNIAKILLKSIKRKPVKKKSIFNLF